MLHWPLLTPWWQRLPAILGWIFGEWALRGKPSLLGACSGAIAGLVGITPACGYIGVGGALILGVVAGWRVCGGVTMLKRLLRVDDPCDVFGIHGVFAASLGVS
ncbi:ammonium transporter [Citrobacter koseri]|uniref:Ammonium transporter n=1 Tax=Citrobacter koseri TaxID=545 RepID=A0A2X2VD33_CITKO|nr:ammonium transporter [Citrobacter koseri]